jgi:UDP-2-acetamido-2,6-beta-L-arabino-hexul-4-ose reductase
VHIVVTGADGFIGKNLRVRLRELGHRNVSGITRSTPSHELTTALENADLVFHLAGANRVADESEFFDTNVGFTLTLCGALAANGRRTPIVYASSTQAELDNAYGRSKRAAEEALLRHGRETDAPVHVFRLTNVFGKWCRPHYNSVVATFCYQIARSLPVTVNDADSPLRLVHVDAVVDAFVQLLEGGDRQSGLVDAGPVFETTVGKLADLLSGFAASRTSLVVPRGGTGFIRALYSTYVSYLPPEAFAFDVPTHVDQRGEFVEMVKTPDCGQVSYFTVRPGFTRGEHYHHCKSEKFLVLRGRARFAFRNIDTGDTHAVDVSGGRGRIVETAPGWTHNITNTGDEELVVMVWANEIFDQSRPDTFAMKVAP